MKIVLMRHGKAADIADFDDDFERPLVSKGKSEVRKQIELLMKHEIYPTHIIASPACRTASTARIAATMLSLNPDTIEYQASLYMGNILHYLENAQLNPTETLLIVGHNPSIGQLAEWFYPNGSHSFPTSSLLVLENENNIDILRNAKPILKIIRD